MSCHLAIVLLPTAFAMVANAASCWVKCGWLIWLVPLQVTTCEQLQAYLSKFVTAEAAEAAPSAAATVDVPEGFKAMKKKGEAEELDGKSCSLPARPCSGIHEL